MIIDFHTHAFSETIAEKAVSKLTIISGIEPYTDGTLNGLKEKMKSENIDISVVLPVATKPSQHETINKWASDIMCENIYSFGSIHPKAENSLQETERIKALGLYGVKFHCDYQELFPDDEKVYPLYQKLASLGLPAIFHGGWDPLSPDFTYGTPQRFAKAVKDNPELTFIIAHLGGMKMWDDVETLLAGKFDNLYFDTSCLSQYIKPEQLEKIIKIHGADKILFGSDCPWDKQIEEINLINSINISEEDKEKIFYLNAKKLLKIK